MKHELKISPGYFAVVKSGVKNFEIRKDDRNFQVGDILVLREYVYFAKQEYTGRQIERRVTYVLRDPLFVKDNFVAMSLKEVT